MKKKIISLFIIISMISASFNMDNLVSASTTDETTSFEITPGETKHAVALIPDRDMPSITIDAKNPVNISHRGYSNEIKDTYDLLDQDDVELRNPINTPVITSPMLSTNTPNYAKTSFLLFEKNSDDSYGSIKVGTNHTAFAVTSDDEQTVRVNPDFNFHLRVVVKKAGPVSVRFSFFPDPGVGNRYKAISIFDPNGMKVDFLNFFYISEEHFLFVAEEKGNYAILIEPVSVPIYFNIVTKTYKPDVLKVDEKISPIIKGIPDSELSDELKLNNILTLDWFKMEPDEGEVCIKEYQAMRGFPVTGFFVPNNNNTGYVGSIKPTLGKKSRAEYMVVIHDNLARYLVGAYTIQAEEFPADEELKIKFGAEEYRAYRTTISSPSLMQFIIKSESNNVQINNILTLGTNQADIVSDKILTSEEIVSRTYFALKGEYIVLFKNQDTSEKWATISTFSYVVSEEATIKGSEDFDDPLYPNVTTELTKVKLDHIQDAIVQPKSFLFRSKFSGERLVMGLYIGVDFFDSNDLIAEYSGQDITFALWIKCYSIFENQLLNTLITSYPSITVSNVSNTVLKWYYIPFPYSMTSDTGEYYITIDTLVTNSTHYLKYPANLRYDIVDITKAVHPPTVEVEFDTSNKSSIINYNLNASKYSAGFTLKIPISGYNWTDFTINTINGSFNAYLRQDLMHCTSLFDEFRLITLDVKEKPSSVGQIGNHSFGIGTVTDRQYIFVSFEPIYVLSQNMSFNITIERIPTHVLYLRKDTNVKPLGTSAPGFEWFATLSAMVLVITFVSKRKK